MGRTIIPRLEHGSIGAVYSHPDPGRNHAVVRRATKHQISLKALDFIERHPGPLVSKNNETNLYNFKGLIAAVTPYAKEALEVRAQAAKAKKSGLKARSRSPSSRIEEMIPSATSRQRAVFYSRSPLTDFTSFLPATSYQP